MRKHRGRYRRHYEAREIHEWVKQKFREDPDLSVSAVNKMVNEVYGESLRGAALSKIRIDIRKELEAAQEESRREREAKAKVGATISRKDTQVRKDFAEELLREDPSLTIAATIDRVRSEYGMGISPNSLSLIRQKLLSKEAVQEYEKPEIDVPEEVPAPIPKKKVKKKAKAPEPAKPKVDPRRQNIHDAMELLVEAVPELLELHFKRGEPIKYIIAEEGDLEL